MCSQFAWALGYTGRGIRSSVRVSGRSTRSRVFLDDCSSLRHSRRGALSAQRSGRCCTIPRPFRKRKSGRLSDDKISPAIQVDKVAADSATADRRLASLGNSGGMIASRSGTQHELAEAGRKPLRVRLWGSRSRPAPRWQPTTSLACGCSPTTWGPAFGAAWCYTPEQRPSPSRAICTLGPCRRYGGLAVGPFKPERRPPLSTRNVIHHGENVHPSAHSARKESSQGFVARTSVAQGEPHGSLVAVTAGGGQVEQSIAVEVGCRTAEGKL